MPRLLHDLRDSPLVFGACTGLASGANLAFGGDEFTDQVHILVVEIKAFVSAKRTNFGGRVIPSAATWTSRSWFFTHSYLLFAFRQLIIDNKI